jgi:hypothetical protein
MTQPSVPPRGRTWTFPASSGQERVWLAQQLDPSSPVFTVPAGTVLAARDAGEVLAVLRAVVARHDALRTELRLQDGELVQVVHSEVPVEAEVVDVRDGGADLSAVVVPTDSAPLWRARVVRLAEGRWRLDLAVHHAVFDAASLTVLHRELAEVAAARRAGRPPRLPELTIQYPDFAVWERGGRTGPAVRAHLAYWREQLAGLPGVHAVPTDRPRRAELRYAGGEARFAVPPPLRTGVDALAARLSCTPFTVLLAAWAALLGRLSGRDEVVVGTTTWGRDQPQLAPLIGMFVNPVVLRVPLDGDPDVAALVRRVRDVVLDATEHAGVPFQAVVEQVLPQRLPGVQPLYQLGVNHVPDSGVEPTVATTAPDDLGLDLARDEGRLRYRSDLFDRESAEAVVRRYLGLLAALVADPARPVADLPLMDAAERARVLGGWGAGPRPEPPVAGEPGTLHGLVLRRLADDPAALAVEGAGTRLTRGELAARVAGTAHHLRERGVGRGDVVAVCGDPSPAVVAALLGVLAAGGTYLPLDPGHPPERLASLAADAGPRWCWPHRAPPRSGPRRHRSSRSTGSRGGRAARPLPRPTTPTPSIPRTSCSPPVRPGGPRASSSSTARCWPTCAGRAAPTRGSPGRPSCTPRSRSTSRSPRCSGRCSRAVPCAAPRSPRTPRTTRPRRSSRPPPATWTCSASCRRPCRRPSTSCSVARRSPPRPCTPGARSTPASPSPTSTVPPRPPSGASPPGSPPARTCPRVPCGSAGRSPGCAPSRSTGTADPCRPARWASSSWPVRSWPAATTTTPG